MINTRAKKSAPHQAALTHGKPSEVLVLSFLVGKCITKLPSLVSLPLVVYTDHNNWSMSNHYQNHQLNIKLQVNKQMLPCITPPTTHLPHPNHPPPRNSGLNAGFPIISLYIVDRCRQNTIAAQPPTSQSSWDTR